MPEKTFVKPVLGISSCLLGNEVRYNGGHQRDRYITNILSDFVEFAPVCPEMGCDMGIPREPVRLVGNPDDPDPRNIRIVTRDSGVDWTEHMRSWAIKELDHLEKQNLCGYVFKMKSPSSGMRGVKVYRPEGGQPYSFAGVGFFARMFMERFPNLPVEDDGRLNDAGIRENFIARIFVVKRWQELVAAKKTLGGLVEFHTRHKMLLLSQSEKHYRALGKYVAAGSQLETDELFEGYYSQLMEGLKLRATVKKNVNVLQHALGHFKKRLSGDEKQECLEIITNYANGLVPLIVPITLMNHFTRKYEVGYLAGQHYLHPHPLELKLRNHV